MTSIKSSWRSFESGRLVGLFDVRRELAHRHIWPAREHGGRLFYDLETEDPLTLMVWEHTFAKTGDDSSC